VPKLPCGRETPTKHIEKSSENDIAGWKSKLEAYLSENKLKQSDSRNRILEVLLSELEHFNVQELCDLVRKRFPDIGPATVYRNLPLFCEVGLIQETFVDSKGQKIYETVGGGHHDHIVCLDCNSIFEFHDEQIESAQNKVTDTFRFEPVGHRHVIYAHCRDLKKKNEG